MWTFALRLSAIIGPLTYGLVTLLTAGNHRLAIASTGLFFLIGLGLLTLVNVPRGVAAAEGAEGADGSAGGSADGSAGDADGPGSPRGTAPHA